MQRMARADVLLCGAGGLAIEIGNNTVPVIGWEEGRMQKKLGTI